MIESLFPRQVICCEGPISSLQEDIHSAEMWQVRQAVRKRRREFVAGRVCARRALAGLGIENYPLLSQPDRCPRWPPGIVGCISHSPDYCAAAVASTSAIVALGLDVEQRDQLDSQLWDLVLNDSELRWLGSKLESERGHWAKLIFSTKECAFKCQFPLYREEWEFEDIEVAFDGSERFRVHVQNTRRTGRLSGAQLEGGFRVTGDRIVTAMYISETSLPKAGADREADASKLAGDLD